MSKKIFNLRPGEMSLAALRSLHEEAHFIEMDTSFWPAIEASTATVDKIIQDGRTVYGINTGFGLLASTRIPTDRLKQLQESLVLSHAVGVGNLLDDSIVRLLMVLKASSLGRGHSGIQKQTLQLLIDMINAEIYPCIPEKGSVGASGDLAPLAHMSCAMIGVGEVKVNGEIISAQHALANAGLKPVALGPKEGLALLNGTQCSTALALAGLFRTEKLIKSALVCGAMSVDAALGSDAPFDDRIHAVRGHKGQREVAAIYRDLLVGSEIRNSHTNCSKVQDPYSLRCQPQVMGACLDQMRFSAQVLHTEANAVSDNPLVFADDGDIISGGNFHAEPVAMAADVLAIVIAEIGALSERRIALLMDKHLSQLPPFLVEDGGVNSGFMIAQVTAAALASENKTFAHPASVDSLPTSANQEDHVSMATFAARRLKDMTDNTAGILAVELLSAAQGIDFRKPHCSSKTLMNVHSALRNKVAYYDKDRYFAPDIHKATNMIFNEVSATLPPLLS